MDKIKWGVIGCANIAENGVIPGIIESEGSELYAIASRSESKAKNFMSKFAFKKSYFDYNKILEDDQVDAVYIPLPNGLHKEWVIKAAQSGKHVLCEKPMGLTAKDSIEMFEVCRENGVLLMEAFAFMHSPQTIRVKQLVEGGAIGRLKYINSYQIVQKNNKSDPRYDKALGGGSVYDLGCYNLLISRHCAGKEPLMIKANGNIDGGTGVDTSCLIEMDFGNNLLATVYCSFECGFGSEYNLFGEKGSIKVSGLFNLYGETEIIIEEKNRRYIEKIYCPSNYKLEVEQFNRCIRHGEKPLMTMENTVGNAAVIDEVLKQIYKI